jgi:hypothetical protein
MELSDVYCKKNFYIYNKKKIMRIFTTFNLISTKVDLLV